jgi:hypothetical protein
MQRSQDVPTPPASAGRAHEFAPGKIAGLTWGYDRFSQAAAEPGLLIACRQGLSAENVLVSSLR